MPNAQGFDVSHWNPPRDWAALSSAMDFVGIKVSEGEHNVDSALAADQAGARGEPFALVWYYHVARPGDPVEQMRRFTGLVGELRPNERYCLDVERSSSVPIDYLAGCLEAIEEAAPDRQHFLYISNGVWTGAGYPGVWAPAEHTALILPRYLSPQPPLVPQPWLAIGRTWAMWQRSQTGRLPGIDGDVDLDEWNGDRAQLEAFARLPVGA